MVADEVQHGQHRLVAGAPQSAAELLEEDRGALGGPQEQHRVDVGQVEALVEQVGGEQHVDPPVAAGPRAPAARSCGWGLRRDGQAGMPAVVEACGHELGVRDADAEAERPHGAEVGDLVPQLLEHDARARASLPV